ncbi:MAG TPA: cyclase family protein [Dongiaceae bacterium]|nr:cyclase family protein [Dongiaceae bacterium]
MSLSARLILPALLLAASLSYGQSTGKPTLDGIATGKTRVVDLSYAISDKMVPWPGDDKAFEAKINGTIEKDGYFTRSFWMLEHYGTHMDAPAHFPPGKTTLEKIAPEKFFGALVVLDVRAEADRDPDYQLSVKKIAEWEGKHGKIPAGAIVVLRTGWASRWPDVQRYRNTDASGKMHFPGFSVEAAKVLLERKVSGLGCDTLSIDPGNSPDFPVHHLVLGAEVYQLENLADLKDVPDAGALLIAAPIKLEGGSGGAARVFALVPAK